MKKSFKVIPVCFFAAVLLCALLLCSCGGSGGEEKPDSGLKAPVSESGDKNEKFDVVKKYKLSREETEFLEAMLNREAEKITEMTLERIEKLTIAGTQIIEDKSVSALVRGYMLDGKTYNFTEGYGNELSALRVFENLKELTIMYAPSLTDISFVSSFSELSILRVFYTNVGDATAISKLPLLERVGFVMSPIEKLAFYPDNGIIAFTLCGTKITDAEAFMGLNHRLTALEWYNNSQELKNLDMLSYFTSLDTLFLDAQELDISFLSQMSCHFTGLYLGGIANKELSCLLKFNNTLTEARIYSCEGIDLTALDELKYLNRITLMAVTDSVRGEKTTKGALELREQPYVSDPYGWFEYDE